MRTFLPLFAGLALVACAKAPPAPPTAADTSARSPLTVNPAPPGAPAPAAPPKPDDRAMPPGPVNPKP